MDNTEECGNAEERGQKRRLIKQWIKPWTMLRLNMYYGHSLNSCYYMYISLHCPSKPQKVIFWGNMVRTGVQLLLELLQEQNDISPHSTSIIKEGHIIVSEKVRETIVWIGIITVLQEIRAKIYVQISMASFCVLSPFGDEV